ncbi:MAG: rhomboid family intramembrane serine protease [Sphingobacteriales bacterium]|nr:rhomboid family intramembrane serine protease [Sphingobacteriales bacterium]MBI3717851.1 rhomboid family intramembrane serine protease [Sphingobacteriales bacterium]
MGIREYDYRPRKRTLFGDDNNSLFNLIVINVVAFVLLYFVLIIFYLTHSSEQSEVVRQTFMNSVFKWVAVPAKLSDLLYRPWTIITHMFAHLSVWQVIGNMFWLWAFGYILQDLTGNDKIIPVYIYGSIAGIILYLLSFNLIPILQPLLTTDMYYGGGAGVMAVAVATTVLTPDYRIFRQLNGGIPLWVITMVYVLVDFAGLANDSFAHHFAHLGGAIMGFIFISRLKKGHDMGEWMNNAWDWIINLFNPAKPSKKQKPVKEQVFYNTGGRRPFKKTANVTEQRIDEILDKISQKGYHMLTEEEKEILRKASEDNE